MNALHQNGCVEELSCTSAWFESSNIESSGGEDMIDRAHVQENAVQLTEEQKIMPAMGEQDIRTGRTIDQFILNERELEWLKRK